MHLKEKKVSLAMIGVIHCVLLPGHQKYKKAENIYTVHRLNDTMRKRISGFIGNLRSPENVYKVNEERAVLLLVICFLAVSIYVHSFEHGVERGVGHLKDEEGYYGWAELYTEGYYSIPLDEARGFYHYDSTFSTEEGADDIVLHHEFGDLDGDGKENDVKITLLYPDGAPVTGANVRVVIGRDSGKRSSENVTDEFGVCVLHDLPLGKVPIEVEIPREVTGTSFVMNEIIDSRSKAGLYAIYSEITLEKASRNVLSGVVRVKSMKGGRATPVKGVMVTVDGEEAGITDDRGAVRLPRGDREHALIGVRPQGGDLSGMRISLGNLSAPPDRKGNAYFSAVNDYRITVSVSDIFGEPVEGVEILIDPRPEKREPLGKTDGKGILTMSYRLSAGEHRLVADKRADGYEPPLASGVALVNGEYHYINHWPPGPSVAISWLIHIGMEDLFGTIIVGLLCLGTWGVARRTFGWQTAALATFLSLTCGITLQLYFGQWMGDLSSTAFVVFGLWLFLLARDRYKSLWHFRAPGERDDGIAEDRNANDNENGYRRHRRSGAPRIPEEDTKLPLPKRSGHWLPVGLSITAGIFFGVGVTMRYSTIVACFMPYILFIGLLAKGSWSRREKTGSAKRPGNVEFVLFIKRLLTRDNLMRGLIIVVPLTLGMAAIGLILMDYNSTYFGGPFNSGYQTQNIMAVITTDVSGNRSLTDQEPPNSFFESYFVWGEDDRENAPYVFRYIAIFIPFSFAVLPALWFRRKEPLTCALLCWIVLTLVIYLSQGWVLKRTVEDIRYYAPLIPPASILSSSMMVGIWRTGNTVPSKKSITRRMSRAGLVIAVMLMLVGTVMAGDNAIHERIGNNNGPPGNDGKGLQNEPRLPIGLLLEEPEKYEGKSVTLVNCMVDRIIDERDGAYLIRDDKFPDKKMLLKCPAAHPGLGEDVRITATGICRKDMKDPGKWMLWVERNDNVKIMMNTRANELASPSGKMEKESGTRGHFYLSDLAAFQTAPPPGGDPGHAMQRPPKISGRKPLSEDLNNSRLFSMAGIALFYAAGIIAWSSARISKRKKHHGPI